MKNTRGFSLVELSIVLVILGLLTGGILAGKSLIHAAELRKLTNDFKKYETAVYSFRDKYFALPGDLSNATSFWGIAGGTGNNLACFNTISTSSATCNGNGDGYIYYDINGTGSSLIHEIHDAWTHMANAGLIEGQYSGGADTSVGYGWLSVPGLNVPPSPLDSSAWYTIMHRPPNPGSSSADYFQQSAALLIFHAKGAAAGTLSSMYTADAWNIDAKLDDGMPATGKIRGNQTTNCSTSVTPSLATYNLSNTAIACSIAIVLKQ